MFNNCIFTFTCARTSAFSVGAKAKESNENKAFTVWLVAMAKSFNKFAFLRIKALWGGHYAACRLVYLEVAKNKCNQDFGKMSAFESKLTTPYIINHNLFQNKYTNIVGIEPQPFQEGLGFCNALNSHTFESPFHSWIQEEKHPG